VEALRLGFQLATAGTSLMLVGLHLEHEIGQKQRTSRTARQEARRFARRFELTVRDLKAPRWSYAVTTSPPLGIPALNS
jgi:hypothetical protein